MQEPQNLQDLLILIKDAVKEAILQNRNTQQEQSENIADLMAGLAKAQGEMSAAAKDSNNPFFNSKYADLNSVWNACRDSLSKHGLAVVQTMRQTEEGMIITTTLGHSSGQWMKSFLPIKVQVPKEPKLDKNGKPKEVNELQLLGSALTYLRRYALAAIVGVAPDEDDDGNSLAQSYNVSQQSKGSYANYQPQPSHPQTSQVIKISSQQLAEWNQIIGTDEEYRKTLKTYLNSLGISDMDQLPMKDFNRFMQSAIQNKQDKEKKQQQEPQNAVA